MSNQSNVLYNDARNNLRVKENKKVSWHVDHGDIRGEARIKDISISGMQLEMKSDCMPTDNSYFFFDSTINKDNFIPKVGRLVWHKKKNLGKNKFVCGVRFVEPAEDVLSNLRQRVQSGILRFTRQRRIGTAVEFSFIIGIFGLTAYVLWLSHSIYSQVKQSSDRLESVASTQSTVTRNYMQKYQASEVALVNLKEEMTNVTQELSTTKRMYSESQQMLSSVTKELEQTKLALVQTEEMLTNAKTEIKNIKELNARDIAKQKKEFETAIALMQDKNIQLEGELNRLQSELDYYAGNIKNIDEGRALMELYKTRMKLVKSKIKHYNREAQGMRKSAMAERDRIRMILGNNGYFMKDGQTIKVDEAKYNDPSSESINNVDAQSARNIKVGVKFVE